MASADRLPKFLAAILSFHSCASSKHSLTYIFPVSSDVLVGCYYTSNVPDFIKEFLFGVEYLFESPWLLF